MFVIEITGRAGATCLPEMVSLYYGIDYYEAIVQLALGMDVEKLWSAGRPKRPVLARSLTSDRTGIVKAIHNRNEKAELSEVDFAAPPENGLIDISFNIRAGEEVRRYENGRDRIGQVILTGKSLQECEERLEEVLANIHIEFTE